jgi:hypothetical protein
MRAQPKSRQPVLRGNFAGQPVDFSNLVGRTEKHSANFCATTQNIVGQIGDRLI